jgi:mono/diheme cytochrome c family protein
MKTAVRFLGYGVVGLLGLTLVAVLTIYAWSEMILRRHYVPEPQSLVPAPPELVAQGERLAHLYGCLACHGKGLTGNAVFDAEPVGDIIAPNLTKLARQRSDVELTTAIRQGIAPGGRGLIMMPADVRARMLPEETAALIAWIRTLPVKNGDERPFKLRLVGRLMLILGDFRLQPVAVKQYRTMMPADLGPKYAKGRQIAASICAECHGPDLAAGPKPMSDINPSFGNPFKDPPSLDIVGAYDLEQFRKLLRTGIPPSGKKLSMMSEVATDDLKYLTDEEIEALHGYLVARAQR